MLETKINPISYDPRRSRAVDISLTYQTADLNLAFRKF